MTQREKVLATTLIGVLLVFGGGLLFHLFVYAPMSEARERRDAENEDLLKNQNALAEEQRQIEAIQKVNPRLSQWAQLSLPPRDPALKKLPPEEQKRKHQANLSVDYERYLSDLMAKAGFRPGTIKVEVRSSPRPVAVAGLAKGKEPPYEQLTFGVSGQGTLDAVARLMRDFHATPLLHHVRTATVGVAGERGGKAAPDGTLDMALTVDALQMNGAEERSSLRPSALAFPPRVLAEPARDYPAMAAKNMFTGTKPSERPRAAEKAPEPKKPTESPADVLGFVKLTMVSWDPDRKRWEATLYDQQKGGREQKVNTGVLKDFVYRDKYDNTMLEAKAVKMEEKAIVIRSSEGKYYRLGVGDFLGQAVDKPLTPAQLKALGITPEPVKPKEKPKEPDDDE